MKLNILNKIIISLLIASTVPFSSVFAKEVCFTQYGGGETCVNVEDEYDIDVNKRVSYNNKNYYDHLKSNEHMFDANDTIYFEIEVRNTSKDDVTIEDITLKDILPNFVKYDETIRGPKPTSRDDNKITYNIGTLEKDEKEVIVIKAKISDDLPTNDKLCVTNIAEVKGVRSDNDDSKKDADYANFCIDLPDVLGEEAPKQLPKAGAENTLAALGAVFLGLGLVYNRKLNTSK